MVGLVVESFGGVVVLDVVVKCLVVDGVVVKRLVVDSVVVKRFVVDAVVVKRLVVESGSIEVSSEGFMLHDRLLRPAHVGVSSSN